MIPARIQVFRSSQLRLATSVRSRRDDRGRRIRYDGEQRSDRFEGMGTAIDEMQTGVGAGPDDATITSDVKSALT
jgi:hypothetical protein